MVLKTLRISLFALSGLAMVAITYVAILLMLDPQPVDPVEVAVLERAGRIVAGAPLYTEVARADEPLLMPGYPATVALLMRLFGPDLWQARMVSLVAMLAIALLALWVVWLETGSWTLAASAMGFVVLGHALLAERPGIARPDGLMMMLVLLGFLALRLTTGAWGALLGAAVLGAAFFVDPRAAWFIAAATVALTLEESRRRPVVFTLAAGAAVAGGYVGLSQLYGPWFNFEAVDGYFRTLRLDGVTPLYFVGDHLLGKLALPTLAALLSFAMPTPPWRGKGGLWMCMGIAALGSGLLATQSAGYGSHVLLPGIVALSLLGPISMQRVTRHLSAWPGSTRLAGRGVVLSALALQFVVFLSSVSPSWWRGIPSGR